MAKKEKAEKYKHKDVGDTDNLQQSKAEDVGPNQKLKQIISQTPSTKDLDSTLEVPVADVDKAKKTKKRKRKDIEGDHKAPPSGDKEEELVQQLPTKKRKNRTEFVDPREDLALNSQSSKALEYAFMQMNKPSKWKFNKARQNWIIRNWWSPETLPEKYLPLTLKYLSKVQGGSRMKLVEEAQTILHPKDTPPDPDPGTSTGKTVQFSEPGIDPIEETILKAKQIPGPLINTDPTLLDSESMSTTKGPSYVAKVSKTHELSQVKKMRAQKLLEVLS